MYPEYIMRNLREYHGLDEDDTSRDEEFQAMSPSEALIACLEYEGICGYGEWLFNRIADIYGINLGRPHDSDGDKEEKAQFVRGFGNFIALNADRTGVVKMEMDEHESVTITYHGGGTHKTSIYADSCSAAMRDILKVLD